MRLEDISKDISPYLIPKIAGKLIYRCLGCNAEFGIERLLYVCPFCKSVLLLEDKEFNRFKDIPGRKWRAIFDYRKLLTTPSLQGIYRFHEFIGPIIPLDSIVNLGEGNTPIVEANSRLQARIGRRFFFKNDGQNPSASFKDRGMASAITYLNYLIRSGILKDVLAICASTGDTSASAALYASYLQPAVKSAVLLPHNKVTPQQLSQPLGSGAVVLEIPGVFDDCMKVVETLSEEYNVALLNSKNAWRILGQESYSYEISQQFDYCMDKKAIFVPIGNAGNITAVMSGFLKFFEIGVIDALPKIIGVQSEHADPVYKYYLEPDASKRKFRPVMVRPSVAQAAMIGNPVSMPRVIRLAEEYNKKAGGRMVFVVQVSEQAIIDHQLIANRNGHIACTQGGETLAGLVEAIRIGIISNDEEAVLDSTAHALKFAGFQEAYFEDRLDNAFDIRPKKELTNSPRFVRPVGLKELPESGKALSQEAFKEFVEKTAKEIASILSLQVK
ncbi:MAG: threonine synthase [Pseudomonadota bacterium]